MATDMPFEKLLIGHGIFPPSVMDARYGDNAEMTKDQLIEKTIADMSRCWCWGDGSDSSDHACCIAVVVAELERRLPHGVIKTCGCFQRLHAGCCDRCHSYFPHRQMSLVDLHDGGKAWVCHAVEAAIFPGRRTDAHGRRCSRR